MNTNKNVFSILLTSAEITSNSSLEIATMKLLLSLVLTLFMCQLSVAVAPYTVCFYDAESSERTGLAKFTLDDLEIALDFCSHVVYGYVGINPETYKLTSLNNNRDIRNRHMLKVTTLKEKFPYVKFLLSVGGDKDVENPEKYLQLLEGGQAAHDAFVESARYLVRSLNFDGLDLSFQLPRNKPRKVHSSIGTSWKSVKKLFSGDFIVDPQADEHKQQFTELVQNLKTSFDTNDLLLSLTVLPNVNSSWYFNVPALINRLDFVNLAAFDFTTPDRNPLEADYTAPLYAPTMEGNRLSHYNVNNQVDHWVSERFPKTKINVGIATYGRAWKMTADSKTDGFPIVQSTNGPAEAGTQTKTSGLLNWAEICLKLKSTGKEAELRRFADPTKKHGTYAFRPADENGEHGVWVSYDDPAVASTKAAYVAHEGLGGIAIFHLGMDDFHGQCNEEKFPILRAIKYRL